MVVDKKVNSQNYILDKSHATSYPPELFFAEPLPVVQSCIVIRAYVHAVQFACHCVMVTGC